MYEHMYAIVLPF